MRKLQMVDLVSQYTNDKEAFDQGMQAVIDSAQFINGQAVKQFSKHLEDYLDCKHVLPCANGTDALQIALMALDLEEGDEVITVPFTFVATVEVIALLKLKPIFVDIEPDSFNMDVSKVEAKITSKTKAIIPVHLFGQSCDMTQLMEIANKHGIKVIEDNAQATGADFMHPDGRIEKCGTVGHMGTTSFYPTKNLGCYGDGGAIFTNDEALAKKIHLITNHGSNRKYYYDSIGVNSRLDSMQAAVLNVKLAKLDTYNDRRRAAADFYDQAFQGMENVVIPHRCIYSKHVFHQYTLKVTGGVTDAASPENARNELQAHLKENGIPSMIYYPVPLHVSNAYRVYGYAEGDFPVAEKMAEQVISLPMHSELDEEQLKFITETVKAYFAKHANV